MILNTEPVYSTEWKEYIVNYEGHDSFYEKVKDRTDMEMISRISSNNFNSWILIETDSPKEILKIDGVVGISENRTAYAA